MIYDFEGHTPKIDPNSWGAPNSVIIGRVELGATQLFGSIFGVCPSKS